MAIVRLKKYIYLGCGVALFFNLATHLLLPLFCDAWEFKFHNPSGLVALGYNMCGGRNGLAVAFFECFRTILLAIFSILLIDNNNFFIQFLSLVRGVCCQSSSPNSQDEEFRPILLLVAQFTLVLGVLYLIYWHVWGGPASLAKFSPKQYYLFLQSGKFNIQHFIEYQLPYIFYFPYSFVNFVWFGFPIIFTLANSIITDYSQLNRVNKISAWKSYFDEINIKYAPLLTLVSALLFLEVYFGNGDPHTKLLIEIALGFGLVVPLVGIFASLWKYCGLYNKNKSQKMPKPKELFLKAINGYHLISFLFLLLCFQDALFFFFAPPSIYFFIKLIMGLKSSSREQVDVSSIKSAISK